MKSAKIASLGLLASTQETLASTQNNIIVEKRPKFVGVSDTYENSISAFREEYLEVPKSLDADQERQARGQQQAPQAQGHQTDRHRQRIPAPGCQSHRCDVDGCSTKHSRSGPIDAPCDTVSAYAANYICGSGSSIKKTGLLYQCGRG